MKKTTNFVTVSIDQAAYGLPRYICLPAHIVTVANGFVFFEGWGTYRTHAELIQIPGAFFPGR